MSAGNSWHPTINVLNNKTNKVLSKRQKSQTVSWVWNINLAVTHISHVSFIQSEINSTLRDKMLSANGLFQYPHVHIKTVQSVFLSVPALLTCRNTRSPPPGRAAPRSAAPVGLVSESFPGASSRSHRAPAAQASQTSQHWRVKGRAQSCSDEKHKSDVKTWY